MHTLGMTSGGTVDRCHILGMQSDVIVTVNRAHKCYHGHVSLSKYDDRCHSLGITSNVTGQVS